MDRYCSKEGKNRRKVTIQFQTPLFLSLTHCIHWVYCNFVQYTPHVLSSPALHILALHHPTRNSADATTDNTPATAHMKTDKPRAPIAHTRECTRARLPTAMLFFLLSQVSHLGENQMRKIVF